MHKPIYVSTVSVEILGEQFLMQRTCMRTW
jgi:hypothetical protein